jgi:hypothetical protein
MCSFGLKSFNFVCDRKNNFWAQNYKNATFRPIDNFKQATKHKTMVTCYFSKQTIIFQQSKLALPSYTC